MKNKIENNKNINENKEKEMQQKFEKITVKFYKAEIKRNILRAEFKKIQKEIENRETKVVNPKIRANKLRIKIIESKIKELILKEERNKENLNKKFEEIKNNPSIKESIIKKSNGYRLQIKFQNNKLKYFLKYTSELEKMKADKEGRTKYITKLDKIRPKVKKLDTTTKDIKDEYLVLKNKIRIEHHHEKREDIALSIKELDGFYGTKQSLFNVSLDFPKNRVIALIGASGSGKSTLLRTFNRINDEIPSFRMKGKILLDDYMDINKLRSTYNKYERITIPEVRTTIGMVFQQPNPFPMSIFKNVTYGPKINGIKEISILREIAEKSLKRAAIWDEVKDNLNQLGTSLSGGQQQRLCIARAIANNPKILLMDEPTSALDPIAASKIEELILELKRKYTIIIVTHSMQQAQRIADYTAFIHEGKLIEYGTTKQIFDRPKKQKTKEYISGKFG